MTSSRVRWSLPPAFEPVREIGGGATSIVCEALQRSTGRSVAVKMLTFTLTDDAARRRFTQECAAMAALAAHPNIVSIIDAGVHEERPWIAMELCRGGSLANAGKLPVARVLDVLIAVADAMEAAHRLGIVHCDIKPGNILLTDFGVPAVADFGIARPTSTAATVVGSGYSLDHAAPEVLDGREPTTATDVYCLGTTVWTLLSGRSPFRDSATTPASAIAKRILLDPFPPAPEEGPRVLAELMSAMTAKTPADRQLTMAEVAWQARDIRRTLGPDNPPRPMPVADHARAVREQVAADRTTYRAPRSAASPAPESPPPERDRPRRRPPFMRLAVLGAVLTALIGGIAVGVMMLATKPVDTAAPSVTASDGPTIPAADTLGLDGMESNPPCDGKFVVIVGSAVTPGRYADDVSRLLSTAPGSHYLETARSCPVFADRTTGGALIYAVYLGPYATLDQACAARARTIRGAVVQQLAAQPTTHRPTC